MTSSGAREAPLPSLGAMLSPVLVALSSKMALRPLAPTPKKLVDIGNLKDLWYTSIALDLFLNVLNAAALESFARKSFVEAGISVLTNLRIRR